MTNGNDNFKVKVTSQIVAQGAYGLCKINQQNGVQIGNVIRVWHVIDDAGNRMKTFLTRHEARHYRDEFHHQHPRGAP